MAETLPSTSTIDPIQHLPLCLLGSDTIPPAPTRSDPPGSTIDWLPNFADLSWVAYGASSLLVISQFPSPLSPNETAIGPIFRQVFELSRDPSSAVNAVSWSPATPSIGELAAAAENCVWVFSHDSASSIGSFCWSQNARLVQSTKVEAVKWTGSGDGIIAGGVEVVLWKRSNKFWEIAWKFKADRPQTLVSATWSVEGPSATAVYSSKLQTEGSFNGDTSRSVLVCHSDKKSGYAKVELSHPLPVSMIQWRPAMGRQSNGDGKSSKRNVLLTCCLDGTVRLWCEVDNGRVRKIGKDDHKFVKQSFCVAAVIEINQSINGNLGMDVFLTWAIEVEGMYEDGEGSKKFISSDGYGQDKAGNCEWIVGFGPERLVSLWAIHCLDDVSPVRFPRVTLWKTLELKDLKVGHLHGTDLPNSKANIFLGKAAVLRKSLSGTPTMCSLIQLLPSNSLVWSLLYTQKPNNIEDAPLNKHRIENRSRGYLNLDGHTGKILQVAVHPYSAEVELAVSLDSNGLLLFWSLSTISDCILGHPTLIPTWELYGKLGTWNSSSKYTSLSWAPPILDHELVLLMGHVGGIDCFVVKIYQREGETIECHYLCTAPFRGHGPYEEGPTNIFSIPLPSVRHEILKSHKFLLLGVWMNGFQALSWEVTMHSYDLSGSYCKCDFEATDAAECSTWRFGTTFSNKRYCVNLRPCSSQLPQSHTHDHVTSFAVVHPDGLVSQISASFSDQFCSHLAYTMATGCANGYLKFWRSKFGETPSSSTPWELVGRFKAHQGPISAICLSNSGQKIATICKELHSNNVSTLSVWESVHIAGSGAFILEDKIALGGQVIALNWLALGNGQLLLGLCIKNQLLIYAQRCSGGQILLKSRKSLKGEIWSCIAVSHTSSPIRDFLWGTRATALVIHDSYLSVISQWLFTDKEHLAGVDSNFRKSNCLDFASKTESGIHSAIFTDCDVSESTVLPLDDGSKQCNSGAPGKTHIEMGHESSSLLPARAQLEHVWYTKLGLWNMLEVMERLGGSKHVYHPDALLMNIFAGNWKRAYSAVRHLVECLDRASEKRCGTENSSHIVPQIPLSNYFEGLLPKSLPDKEFNWGGNAALNTFSQFQKGSSQFVYNLESDSSNKNFMPSSTKSELNTFIEPLEGYYELAAITTVEKTQILAVIDLLGEMTNPNSAYGSLDEPGQRFWVALKFQQLHFFRRFGRQATMEELDIDSALIVWAYHSDCEENLFASVLPNEPSWPEMCHLGVGFWFTNAAQLRAKMEKLARLQYLKKKDPKDCALLYIALNRIQVLVGLFKISKDEKDKPLVGFLSRNFKEEKNKAAALKNAYVLMGKHQLELAVAFFLLGGDFASAINVCAKNLGDEQLALVICRLVEGHGGPAEHHLITKFILPSAIEKGDNWLASLLEWEMGNYYQSFMRMLGFQIDSTIEKSAFLSSNISFLEPNIGLYCLTLASKNNMRNAVGDQNAAILGRWAILMTATALNRCGLSVEALECLSSSLSILGNMNHGNISSSGHSDILHGFLMPSSDSSNWLSDDVAFHLDYCAKLDLALKHLSKLIREHPSWEDIIVGSIGAHKCSGKYENHQFLELLESFRHKFYLELGQYEQKFSLLPLSLIRKILVSLYNQGLLFVGYDLFHGYINQEHSQDKIQTVDRICSYSFMSKPFFKATEETSLLLSRFVAACSITCSQLKSYHMENDVSCESRSSWSNAWGYYLQSLLLSLRVLRASLRIKCGSLSECLTMKFLTVLDLIEYSVHFAYAWLQRNSKGLLLMVEPLLIKHIDGQTLYEVDIANLKKLLPQIVDFGFQSSLHNDVGKGPWISEHLLEYQGLDIKHSIPEDERWKIVGACLWQHVSRFMKHKLKTMSFKLDDSYFSGLSHGLCAESFSVRNLVSDDKSLEEQIRLISLTLAKLLKTTVEHVSSYHVKQLASCLHEKIEYGLHVKTLIWLEVSSQSQTRVPYQSVGQNIVGLDTMNDKDGFDVLWKICADPKMLSESFVEEKISSLVCFDHKPLKGWSEVYEGVKGVHEADEIHNQEATPGCSSASTETGSPVTHPLRNGLNFLSSWQKDTTVAQGITSFLSPREVLKRNGELLEALCVNSIHQGQAAIASNRKGILFFNWKDDVHFRDQSDYIWSEADWPLNGWAGSESTPAPTCVSPGIGLGNKKGAHLGLGGATVGVGSFARPGRDLTGGGAFGIPGYAGIGASGLGWETLDEFEEFVDPPPGVENISTRAFSSHPSRPLFLVGSINTHIYLWEFGKEKATATYGVLPAANVPPPYALASISAVQFDHCGHRFATAALDGTVCTWQLEVGGRNNICPTESSLCFDGHASDITYVTSSGSIIAAAGYGSNGVNVVVWDTLAPPSSSQASIICHKGGACSLSVFDNDVGSGSISPLIVTGGKDGDVRIHDFRYIATGKTKRHKHSSNGGQTINTSSNTDTQTGNSNKVGEQNLNGILWYIPKAHSGSISKICTIPNTSLFLTGSKDGDVKLWDAKKSRLVFHWSKLHERHTFLQPSSRGYGGVVRAAVTDIQTVSHGFLTCGGDGSVKLIELKDQLLKLG
ncbi:WD repeat containing protein [Parasponia andersonii]|uniref:WD repeat containing protein n=1 Tax=Parasponia andersonii TaxID=3476 RepID=A0A2P5B0Q9_PARAD|nr:WD repeat containing protein [Parasponia andersonii]